MSRSSYGGDSLPLVFEGSQLVAGRGGSKGGCKDSEVVRQFGYRGRGVECFCDVSASQFLFYAVGLVQILYGWEQTRASVEWQGTVYRGKGSGTVEAFRMS